MVLDEDAYGTRKRVAFISDVIARTTPGRVLDVGCGTGNQLTRPLAERFPTVKFVGLDSDRETIEFAREVNILPNLRFDVDVDGMFDLIVASEVLEHVEDPVEFLRSLRSRLASDAAQIIVTVPNGFGPFELAAAAEKILHGSFLSGVTRSVSGALRTVKHHLVGVPSLEHAHAKANTLADSPHINFFTRSDISAVARAAGFAIEQEQSRTLACGYGFDRLIKGPLTHWNAKLADVLPPVFSSGWMFLLQQAQPLPGAYVPGRWAIWKRRSTLLNVRMSQGHDRLPT
jgi:SAM-dependent methyltransferase